MLTRPLLSAIMASESLAAIGVLPLGCDKACTTQWASIRGNIVAFQEGLLEGGVWTVSCQEAADLCGLVYGGGSSRGVVEAALSRSLKQVSIVLWTGSHFEAYRNRLSGEGRLNRALLSALSKAGAFFNRSATSREEVLEQTPCVAATPDYPLGWAEKGQGPGHLVDGAIRDGEGYSGAPPSLWWAEVSRRAVSHFGGTALDASSLTFDMPGFVNGAEVAHLVALGASRADPNVGCGDVASDPVLQAIGRRIANLTGIAPHAGENSQLQARTAQDVFHNHLHHDTNKAPRRVATVIIYLSGGDGEDGQLFDGGLVRGEGEVLGGGVAVRGGHTIFPCLVPALAATKGPGAPKEVVGESRGSSGNINASRAGGRSKAAAARKQLEQYPAAQAAACLSLVRSFAGLEAPPRPRVARRPGSETACRAVEALSAPPLAAGFCRELAEGFARGERSNTAQFPWSRAAVDGANRLCRRAAATEEGAGGSSGSSGGGGGVWVAPRRGHALLFASDAGPDASEPLPLAWHKGCQVTTGAKLMFTTFKAKREGLADRAAEHRRAWERL